MFNCITCVLLVTKLRTKILQTATDVKNTTQLDLIQFELLNSLYKCFNPESQYSIFLLQLKTNIAQKLNPFRGN